MDSLFKKNFDQKIKKSEWLGKEDFEGLYTIFNEDKENNNVYLENLVENKELEKITSYYNLMNFIKYIGKNHNYKNEKIKIALKEFLDVEFEIEKPEHYSDFLKTLYSINKDDKEYYINQYELLKKENKLYHDINESFLEVFIDLKINNKFIEAFEQFIIDSKENYYSLEIGFNYLISLKSNIFKKYFLDLLSFFYDDNQKEKLIDYYEYTGLIKDGERKEYGEIIKSLFEKVEKSYFKDEDYNKLFDFLCGDIEFALKNYQRDLLKNYFINEFSKFLLNKKKSLIIEILKNIDKNIHLFGMESFIIEYLNIDDVENFINILKGTESENIIYFTYDILKQDGKSDFIELFENNEIIGLEILKRNKVIKENNKKFKEQQNKILGKEKNDFFVMLNPEEGHFYPKLFRDYSNYINSEKGLKNIFNDEEIDKIEASLKSQIITFLEMLNIKNYLDRKIETIIIYEKAEDNKYTITNYSVYLSWIIEISKKIKIDFTKYYKVFVLFYPLLRGDSKIEDIFKIIGNNLEKEDIDYILKVYSEDLHKKAIGLRYYHTQNLVDFYNNFESKFELKTQKQKLEKICLNMINGDDEDNIYYKEGFLKIYSKIGGKTKFNKLWKNWNEKYPNFNYFKDVVDNENGDKSEIDKMKFLTFINKELILSFQDKKAVLWRIEQIKNGKIECIDDLKIEYPYNSTGMRAINSKYSELGGFGRNEYNFSYIFSHISKIDIRKEILDLLKFSFEIQSNLISGKLEGDYEMYYGYLRKIFFDYIEHLDKSLIEKDYYYKIKSILDEFDYKITYNFNLEFLRKKLGIDDFEEEAKIIIEKEGIEGVVKLLNEKKELNDKLIEEKLKSNISTEKININDKNCILFVEGITDIIILETAWEKLYGSKKKNFRIENGFDCFHIGRGFKEDNYGFLDSNPEKIIIGMLDYDSAFEQQKRLLEVNKGQDWKLVEDNDINGRLVKHNRKKGYVFLLPVPLNRLEYANSEYESKSLLSIELLFSDNILTGYTNKIKLPGGNNLLKMDPDKSKKMKFAQFINTLLKEEFINFKPIFEIIEKIINLDFKS